MLFISAIYTSSYIHVCFISSYHTPFMQCLRKHQCMYFTELGNILSVSPVVQCEHIPPPTALPSNTDGVLKTTTGPQWKSILTTQRSRSPCTSLRSGTGPRSRGWCRTGPRCAHWWGGLQAGLELWTSRLLWSEIANQICNLYSNGEKR